MLDPVGLFRSSALVTPDAADEESLDAANRLAALLRENLDASAAGTEATPNQGSRALIFLCRIWEKFSRQF